MITEAIASSSRNCPATGLKLRKNATLMMPAIVAHQADSMSAITRTRLVLMPA